MEGEFSRFKVPLSSTAAWKVFSWRGVGIVLFGSGVAWVAQRFGVNPTGALFLWCVAVVGILHLLKPSHLVFGVDGVLVVWPLRRALFPWSYIATVDVDTPDGNFRRSQALFLRVTDGRTLRIPASLPHLSMDRVKRFIETRLKRERPPLPNILGRLETSCRAAGVLLEKPGGLVYRDDALPPNEWWRVFESSWAKPHERVAAALALGADAYAANHERVETILGCFASQPLSRITRRAFAVENPDEAHRLLQEARALGAPRRWRIRPQA